MFTSTGFRAASAYKRVSLETSDSYQLVNMLFDGLLQSIADARAALKRGDVVTKCTQVSRAVRLIEEGLKPGLDVQKGGDLAANLNGLYGYCVLRLIYANLHNDDAVLGEVARVIEPLADGWKQMNGKLAA